MFWKMFKKKRENDVNEEIFSIFPNIDQEKLKKAIFVGEQLAKVALADYSISEDEKNYLKCYLLNILSIEEDDAYKLTGIILKKGSEFLSRNSRDGITYLKENLDTDEKFKLVCLLFELASTDNKLENVESEEIRLICKGLTLSDKHFLAARSQYKDHIQALKKF